MLLNKKLKRKPVVSVVLLVGVGLFLASTLFFQQNAFAKANKVKICHKGEVIEVSENALDAHLNNHGDCLAEEAAEKGDPCECEDGVLEVVLEGVAISSTLTGIAIGDSFSVEFMLDTSLPDQDLSPDSGFFIDPWLWHWIVTGKDWDWLFGFTIEILLGGAAGGNDDLMVIRAVFDDDVEDMVMGLGRGSEFITTLVFEAGTLNGDSLPDASAFPCKSGGLLIIDEIGEQRFEGAITGGQAQ